MKILLSWSGERSRQIALALKKFLGAFRDLDIWMSDTDIHAGQIWPRELENRLQTTDFGILCLTPENMVQPWVLFEAGAIGGALRDRRVVPYLFQLALEDVPFPLAQFQSVPADQDGSYKLLLAVNAARSERLPDKRLKRSFEKNWPHLGAALQSAQAIKEYPRNLAIFLREFPTDRYKKDFERAEELWLVGISLADTIQGSYDNLKEKLGNKDFRSLKVLLARPDASTVEPAVRRKSRLENVDTAVDKKTAEIRISLEHLLAIRNQSPEAQKLEIRTTNYPLGYGVHAMNPERPDGALYIKLYPYKVAAETPKPKFFLLADRDEWYMSFLQELKSLWRDGEDRLPNTPMHLTGP